MDEAVTAVLLDRQAFWGVWLCQLVWCSGSFEGSWYDSSKHQFIIWQHVIQTWLNNSALQVVN